MTEIDRTRFSKLLPVIKSDSFDPNDWRDCFLEYDSEFWNISGGGLVEYHDISPQKFNLMIMHVPEKGFFLRFSCVKTDSTTMAGTLLSVFDQNQLNTFAMLGGELPYSLGTVLPPEIAWLAIEDFLNNPREPSPRIQWTESRLINFPDTIE